MRIAIIAHLHASLAAVDAVLAGIGREVPDHIVCLGDVAACGPQAYEVVQRLRDLDCPVVLGNANAFLLDPPPERAGADDDTRRIDAIDRWCAQQLSSDDLAFLHTFRPTFELPLGSHGSLLCYHGSPRSFDDVISASTPEEALTPMLAGLRATVMAGGHSHFQMLRRYEEVVLLNPGSVGPTYDLLPGGDARVPPRAEYAVVTAEDGQLGIELRRVSYDQASTVRAMFERGMPHADWWAAGWR